MTDNNEVESSPAWLQMAVTQAYKAGRQKFWTWLAAMTIGVLTGVGVWFVGIAKWAMDEFAKAALEKSLAEDQVFAKNIAGLVQVPGLEVGSVIAWPTSREIPSGWHICDGSVLEAKADDPIAKVLDIDYGSVGLNKVQLPDYRGYFLRGLDDRKEGRKDPDAPRTIGKWQSDSMPEHSHAVDGLGVALYFGRGEAFMRQLNRSPLGYQTTDVSIFGTGSKREERVMGRNEMVSIVGELGGVTRPSGETRPKNYAINWIIRVK